METVVLWVLRGSLFLSVLALGLRAGPRDATYLLRRPEALARAILAMNGIMALLAAVMIASFDLRPVVKLALAAMAVSPVPPILPRRMLKAGCQTGYAVGLLVAAALASIVLVPLSMAAFQALFRIPLRMSAVSIAVQALSTILVPLAFGIALRHLLPNFSQRARRPLNAVAMVILAASAVTVLIAERNAVFSLIGNGTLAVFVAFSVVGLAVGHLLGRPEGANCVALALSTATRHPGVAVAIAHTNYPDERLAAPAVLLFFLVSTAVSGLYLAWFKRSATRAAERREQH